MFPCLNLLHWAPLFLSISMSLCLYDPISAGRTRIESGQVFVWKLMSPSRHSSICMQLGWWWRSLGYNLQGQESNDLFWCKWLNGLRGDLHNIPTPKIPVAQPARNLSWTWLNPNQAVINRPHSREFVLPLPRSQRWLCSPAPAWWCRLLCCPSGFE